MNKQSQHPLLSHCALVIAGSAAFAMSTLFSSVKPVILSRFVEEMDFTQSLAGLLVALPFVGIAVSSLLVSPLLHRVKTLPACVVFGALLIAAQYLNSRYFASAVVVAIAQFISGVCVGLLMGYSSQIIATTRAADQIFGFVDMVAVLLMSLMIAGVSMAISTSGLQGGFLFSAVVAALFVIIMAIAAHHSPQEHIAEKKARLPLEITLRPLLLIAMGVLFITASGLGFAFMFTMAHNLGLSYDQSGKYIGAILFFSSFACLAGGYCAARFGAVPSLLAAFVTCALGWFVAINSQSPWVYLTALVPAICSLQFNFPILLGLYGSLDESGQWAAIGTPLLTSGFAWAAISAGLIVEHLGLAYLAWLNVATMLLCAVLLALAEGRLRGYSEIPIASKQ